MKIHPKRNPLALAMAAATAVLYAGAALAQTSPDAGSLLQQIEGARPFQMPPQSAPQVLPAPMRSLGDATATVTLTGFKFSGNTLIGTEVLRAQLGTYLNRPLSFAELQNAATAVAQVYRQAGWIVRAYLPQQDIQGGVLNIQVVEAVLGTVRMDGVPQRVSEVKLKSVFEAAQPVGQPLKADMLDRGLLLMSDLPGVQVSGRLAEGSQHAQTDLVIKPTDGALVTGDLMADNFGSRSTGPERLMASLDLNSPARLGDQATAQLMHTQGSDYARVGYSLPVGHQGWRAGVNTSYLSYKVINQDFSAAQLTGTSTSAGLEASYPVLRGRLSNLYLALNYDTRHFDNRLAQSPTTHYKTRAMTVGLNANRYDNAGAGGVSSGSLALVSGSVDLGGSPNEAADAASTRTAGAFQKIRYAVARQQVLTESVSMYAGIVGQFANKNLDSSEKFYLGGAGGVRAYPSSEGGGAEGHLLKLELRKALPGNLMLTGFYDRGSVTVNKNNNITGAAVPNSITLQGAGVSLAWTTPLGLSLTGSLAHRIGQNPNPTSTGADQDGTLKKNRLWIQASLSF